MEVTPQVFERYRFERNNDLRRNFERLFDKLISKYNTLHKHVLYKKISKMSFISKNTDEHTILSILNKLSPLNVLELRQKIMARCTSCNAANFIQQTLDYASNASLDPSVLEAMISEFAEHIEEPTVLRTLLHNYIWKYFDTVNDIKDHAASEKYGEFVDRHTTQTRLIRMMCMIIELCTSKTLEMHCPLDLLQFFDRIRFGLKEHLELGMENVCRVYVECLHTMLEQIRVRALLKDYVMRLHDMNIEAYYSRIPNQLRFRIYDIFDLIKKN